MTCSVTPHTAPSSAVSRSTTRACSTTSMPGSSTTAVQRGDERAGDLGAGGVAAGVRDPVAVVPALAGQLDLAAGVAVELGTERDELAHPRRAPRSPGCAPPRGRTARRRRRGCRRGAPAGCPRGRAPRRCRPGPTAVEPADSTVLVTSSTRSTRSRSRSAQVSPAMPEPTTTTSALVVHPGAGALSRRGSVTGVTGIPAPQTSARACDTSENTSSAPPPGPTRSGVLSISRVVPTRAATASSASPRYHSGTSARVCGCTSTR